MIDDALAASLSPFSLSPFRTPVRGHAFAAAPEHAADPRPGTPAVLAREPANPADELAVAVWVGERAARWRIGYLDRGVAARLAPRLDSGLRLSARIEGWIDEPGGRWWRPLVLVLPESGDGPPRPTVRRDHGPVAAAHLHRSAGLWGRPPGVSRRRCH